MAHSFILYILGCTSVSVGRALPTTWYWWNWFNTTKKGYHSLWTLHTTHNQKKKKKTTTRKPKLINTKFNFRVKKSEKTNLAMKKLKETRMVAMIKDRQMVKNPWLVYPEGDHGSNCLVFYQLQCFSVFRNIIKAKCKTLNWRLNLRVFLVKGEIKQKRAWKRAQNACLDRARQKYEGGYYFHFIKCY